MAKNTFCHIEFQSTDLERSQKFYQGLFDWSFKDFGGGMVVFGQGDQHLGGLQKAESVAPGSSPSVWIEVDALEPYLEKAPKLGGQVASEKSPIPNVGWSAMVNDPDGNPVGLVQFSS
ncbi:MAG: uncharacterized protein QOJ65_2664 [Fimbriimonadaceae bacterium]|jgi:predicted enzyme related to lactoylglutathione lyase|nr:uncharacterized protein [Fimbriimonadaceae bacterium]